MNRKALQSVVSLVALLAAASMALVFGVARDVPHGSVVGRLLMEENGKIHVTKLLDCPEELLDVPLGCGIFRVIRVIRLMRTYGIRSMFRWFLDNRAQGALFVVLTAVIVVLAALSSQPPALTLPPAEATVVRLNCVFIRRVNVVSRSTVTLWDRVPASLQLV